MPPSKRKPSPRATSPAVVRDEAKQETRDALIRAGMELFAQQGLDVPSLDALCARAGFTRGAFYVHFADREAFIVAVMESATNQFVEAVLATGGQVVGLGEIVGAFAASVSGGAYPVFGEVPMHQFLAACARSQALRERYLEIVLAVRNRLADAVRADQHSGKIRADVDPALAAGLLVALVLGVGAMAELSVPFDPAAHSRSVMQLLSKTAARR